MKVSPATHAAPSLREVEKAKHAAREFEGFLLGELFSRMRPHSEDPLFGGGFGAETMQGMLDEELGRIAAQSGGIGLQQLLAARSYGPAPGGRRGPAKP